MAKKTKELSLEEKLEQALVPVDEQPYEVPENWNQIYLKSVVSLGDGEKIAGEEHKYLEVKYLRGNKEPDIKDSGKYVEDGDYVILVDGENSGEIFKLSESGYMGSTFKKLSISNKIDTDYILYFIQQNKEFLRNNKKGSAIPHLNKELFGQLVLSLPPVEEQKRIVKAIESMFAKLDEAKEIAEETLNSFEDRRAAILHKGFTGELTSSWREKRQPEDAAKYLAKIQEEATGISRQDFKFWKNDSLPIGWCESKIGNLLYFAGRIGWKGLKADEYTEEGPFLLSVYNLNDGDEVTYNRVYHITEERYEESPEIMVEIGDVLLTKDGAGIGKLGYVKELPQKATINSSLLLIRPGEAAISKYVYYILSGPNLQRIVKERITGSATPHLFQRDIKEFTIPVPSIEEQEKIVDVIDKMLEKEERAKEVAETVISSIDMMKKSILAKAFRGELGTNIESEESSIELLKSILQEV